MNKDIKTGDDLIQREIIHDKCNKRHIDEGKYATYNHAKHLCLFCNEFFYEKTPAVGI